jgi:signal transduction histidine kinase
MFEEIKRLNAKKDEFIGMASHELRTPLTSLKGYLQIFEKSLSEDNHNKSHIKKAVQQVSKLTSLITDLLDVSKIETGKLPLVISEFDLKDLVREVIELMQYSTNSHSIDFTGSESEIIVRADRQRIEQVIINLISNAVKYSPNACEVKVFVSKKDCHGRVEVQDFGIGITAEQQSHIFSRFYRVEEAVGQISGLGIGLYISKEVITRHNGQLNVRSEVGKGSTFYFDIPL